MRVVVHDRLSTRRSLEHLRRPITPRHNPRNPVQPGHKYYEALRGAGLLAKCVCGQQKLGWQYPEFIVKIGEKVWSVGRDARSNTISCGPNGYQSARYGNEPVACY